VINAVEFRDHGGTTFRGEGQGDVSKSVNWASILSKWVMEEQKSSMIHHVREVNASGNGDHSRRSGCEIDGIGIDGLGGWGKVMQWERDVYSCNMKKRSSSS
jgi:hypothetical protein